MSGSRWIYWAGVLMVISCVALTVPSAAVARKARQESDAAAGTVALSRVQSASSALLSAARVERGQGAIYLNGSSLVPDQALLAARRATNEAVGSWKVAVSGRGLKSVGPTVSRVEASLGGLSDQRIGVSQRSGRPDDHFSWYTGLISQLTALAANAAGQLERAGVGSVAGYVSLLQVAEYVGQERGQIAGLLASPTRRAGTTRATAQEVASLRAARGAALANVALVDDQRTARALAAIDATVPAGFVRSVEEAILNRHIIELQDLTADRWFGQASQLLDAYQVLITNQNHGRQVSADHRAAQAAARAHRAAMTMWAVLGASLLLGFGLLGYARNRIRGGEFTSQRQIQREVAARQAMLQAVLANSQSLIYVKDLEGRYLMANAPLLRLLSLTEEELIGRDDTSVEAGLAPVWRQNDLRARDGEYAVEEWSDGPDGRFHYESVKFPLYDADGQMYAICGISLDVTAKRQAADAMAAATAAAVEANATKSAFLAAMSHEIRTPMNAVIGMTDLLMVTSLDTRQQEYVQTIRTSGDALLSVINNILDYSRFEAEGVELEELPFDLHRCVEESLSMVAVTAAGLDLVADIDPRCPRFLVGDAGKLRQVLVNVIGNAVKFTERGDVLVKVTAQSPAESGRDGQAAQEGTTDPDRVGLAFSIRDTGIGIPPERMDRLFRSFSQVDASTTRLYGGTGLGLVISQAIVRAMGDDITVTSAVGIGSTFSFAVTLNRVPADWRAPPADREVNLTGHTALIVDDNPTNRRVLGLQLAQVGIACVEASGGTEALAILVSRRTIDFAVVDFNMPGMNGRELAERIRQLPARQDLPLILLTSLETMTDDVGELFSGYHTKPIRAQALQLLIAEVLGCVPVPPASGPAGVPAQWSRTRLRILVVEDNRVNQRVAHGMLDNLGHLVGVADDGRQALQALERNDYDVVLMDIHMPQLDGLAATRAIRSQFPSTRQPHIIAMTASSLPEDRRACLDAGMDGYLLKPIRADDLDQALRTIRPAATVSRPDPVGPARDVAVDLSVLTRLVTEMGDPSSNAQVEIIDVYLEQSDGWIRELDTAAQTGDLAQVRLTAHTLGSGSALLGAGKLADLLTAIGRSTRAGPTDLASAGTSVTAEYDRVAGELRAHRATLLAGAAMQGTNR